MLWFFSLWLWLKIQSIDCWETRKFSHRTEGVRAHLLFWRCAAGVIIWQNRLEDDVTRLKLRVVPGSIRSSVSRVAEATYMALDTTKFLSCLSGCFMALIKARKGEQKAHQCFWRSALSNKRTLYLPSITPAGKVLHTPGGTWERGPYAGGGEQEARPCTTGGERGRERHLLPEGASVSASERGVWGPNMVGDTCVYLF